MIATLAIMVSLVFLSTISPNPKLVLLGQSDGAGLLRDKQAYIDAAHKILSGTFVDKSKITVDTEGFNRSMKQQFPELSTVDMTLPLMGRRPIVEVVAARPVIRLVSQGQTFLLDASGRALIKQSGDSNIPQMTLPAVTDATNVTVQIGKGALPRETVTFITTFVQQLTAQGLTPTELTLPIRASELQVKLKETKYYIKASVLTDPRVAAGQYFAVKKKLEADGNVPSEYVDLRIEEKVFVK